MVSSLATLLSMLGNIAQRLPCLWARVANLNELPGNSLETQARTFRSDHVLGGNGSEWTHRRTDHLGPAAERGRREDNRHMPEDGDYLGNLLHLEDAVRQDG